MAKKLSRLEFLSKTDEYITSMKYAEKADNTVKKYDLGIRTFVEYATNQWGHVDIFKDRIIEYKQYLKENYKLSTANLYITALNQYFKYIDREDMCIKTFKLQKKNTLHIALTMENYTKMAKAAWIHNKDTYYLMLALASTGVRIDELQYITVESIKMKECQITNKGKSRDIVIGEDESRELLEYCKQRNVTEGYVFFVRNPEKYICESTALRRLKRMADMAGIDKEKVNARNLRHLFAKRYMDIVGNLTGLQNILGHSSVATTMIYTCTTNCEKRKDIGKLGFVKIKNDTKN